MPINDKQRHFIREYTTNGHNASKAYSKAYPEVTSGWNAHGARLIAKDSIRAEIDVIEAKVEEKYSSSRESLIKRLMEIVVNGISTAKEITSAASLIGDFMGHKRDTAPNQEREEAILARMSDEELETARIVAQIRTEELARGKLKAG